MLQNLKNIFPSLIHGNTIDPLRKKDYQWFITPNNEIIGIKKEEITSKDKAILMAFLKSYHGLQLPSSDTEKKWMTLLFDNEKPNWGDMPETYRFIFFSLSEEPSNLAAFQEAIHGLFPYQVPILWETPLDGIIIQEIRPMVDDDISFSEIIDVFSSDFYLDLQLFISPFFTMTDRASYYYKWLKKAYKLIRKSNQKAVITYTSAIPYLLTESLSEQDYLILIESILQETTTDEALLKTIQIFLECNSNVSLAAKKMYMHRNSLQYRIDKFIEKTSIDVKQFEEALSVYLILLLKKKNE
ncbi:Leucine-rich protein [Paraliobacillus sp. PM-2]|uniref:PucR family transcriptional regulator n=1 Tax=Paraliobacillus sp. PM-2 TaxID=1462524 RepID=UPI00061BA7ED|nr:helix-turn-helix domain-containing protein [Paraliobacillus sp. PM-2]CQR47057.1 Leucine-rich protein [Paraliobacillus sp. PM-2]